MKSDDYIKKAKEGFETSFKEVNFYNKQTVDDSHLALLLELINPKDNEVVVDLGTGTGYIAFALAKQNEAINIIGVDIVTETLQRNRQKASNERLKNLRFIDYDGSLLPFENECVDTIVSRYALHHFPDIEGSFRELSRILKPGGKLIIADPTPNENDSQGFVDQFMQMKPDGHIKFYTLNEYETLLDKNGFRLVSHEMTKIRFPRKEPNQYKVLLLKTQPEILKGYEVTVEKQEIWITEKVLNMVFMKKVE